MIHFELKQYIEQAVEGLKANKLRAVLTMLGIIIGVASVIILLNTGQGAQRLITGEIESFGTNMVIVIAGEEGSNTISSLSSNSMKLSDVDAVLDSPKARSVGDVTSFSAVSRVQIQSPGQEEVAIDIYGVGYKYFPMSNLNFAFGESWDEKDERALKKVAVIGSNAKENIYGENAGSVVGKKVKLKGQSYKIVGELEERISTLGNLFGDEANDGIFIPTEAAQKFLLGTDYIFGMMAEATSKEAIGAAKEEITEILRKEHRLREDKENDFTIQTQDEIVGVLGTVTGVFTLFLAALAGISLLVGGIGIMNIMLVSVTERIREIGLRKSVGATRRNILMQFLIEATLLTGSGGLLGIVVGLVISYIISLSGGWDFQIDILTVLFAFVGSAVFGIVFGAYPANRAAKFDPIKALRHE